jgi:hypothetical protein
MPLLTMADRSSLLDDSDMSDDSADLAYNPFGSTKTGKRKRASKNEKDGVGNREKRIKADSTPKVAAAAPKLQIQNSNPEASSARDNNSDEESIASEDLEIPYAENLLPDDEDDWGEDPALSEKRTEPLRPGDVVTYRALIFVAGDDRGKRTATVLNTDPDRLPMITLSNGDILPNDHEVKRIEVLENGKLVPHPYGYYRPIESFRITKAGSGGIGAGAKHEARRVGRIIDKNLHKLQKKAEADNFAPMDIFNFRRKRTKTPTRNAVSASDAADAPSESIESFSDDDFEMGKRRARAGWSNLSPAAATSAVTPRGRRTKQVPTHRRIQSDSDSLGSDEDDYAKSKTQQTVRSMARSANKGVPKSKSLADSSDSESSKGLAHTKGDKHRSRPKPDEDSGVCTADSNKSSPGPRAAPLPLKRKQPQPAVGRQHGGRDKSKDKPRATSRSKSSTGMLWKHSRGGKCDAFDQSVDESDDSVDLGTAAFAVGTDRKSDSRPSTRQSNTRKRSQLDKSSQHNSVDLSADTNDDSDDLGDAVFAGKDRNTGSRSSSRPAKAKKTPPANDFSGDDDDDENFPGRLDEGKSRGIATDRSRRSLQQGLAEIDASRTPTFTNATPASASRAANAKEPSLLKDYSSDEDEDLAADLPASAVKGASRLESLNKGLAEIDAAGTPSAKTASKVGLDAGKPSSSNELKVAADLSFTKQNRVSPRPVRGSSAKSSTDQAKGAGPLGRDGASALSNAVKSIRKIKKSKASVVDHSLSMMGLTEPKKKKRITKTDPFAFDDSDDASDSNEAPVIEVREKRPDKQGPRKSRQKGQEQKMKRSDEDMLLLGSDNDDDVDTACSAERRINTSQRKSRPEERKANLLESGKRQVFKTPKGESATSASHLADSDDDLGGSARPVEQMKRLSHSANKPSASKENAKFTTPNLPLDWETPTTGSVKKNRKTYSSRSSKHRSKS